MATRAALPSTTGRRLVYDELAFGECPRWHDGRLWLSDIFGRRVIAISPGGDAEEICTVEHHPAGLGWLPDGRLLVVSMADRRLLRVDPDGLTEHADLSAVCPGNCNDMVVDGAGNAYIGNVGFPYGYRGATLPVRRATRLVLVTPDGGVRPQPGTLMCPNGCAISADGSTLVVAQSHMGRLTAYAIAQDASLQGERVFADLPAGRHNPDGLCIDAEGAVWVADPHHSCCLRVRDGGQLTDIVDTAPWECVACMLGGEDLRTLFLVLVAPRDAAGRERLVIGGPPAPPGTSRVEALEVEVPGAGWPR
jgi:sugar lactone lactonase YvrE